MQGGILAGISGRQMVENHVAGYMLRASRIKEQQRSSISTDG